MRRMRPPELLRVQLTLVMHFFFPSFDVHGSELNQNTAPTHCWCVGDQHDRSSEKGQANSLW